MIFAQADSGSNPGITDNAVLDQWRIPFGDWMDQVVDWIDNEAGVALDIFEWPFENLIDLVIDDILLNIAWIWVVLAMGVIATFARNLKQGVFTVVALTICGLLGNTYWILTAKTLGFIAVAVFLCVLVGIPLGVLCGRVDAIWGVVRPALDAMQVVHSFVYMLPFIFFFGIGEVSATMVTMVFALPPLVRLTNLGIRQVPEDVVEASRAYGAPELRVLTDVQLPLARPAIMTGINQTLLLSISMLGIAAIMGAGGLAQPMFQALSNQDPAQSASSGLSFFLVAVVLDRITQRDETVSFFTRLRRAWAHRDTPEELVEADSSADDSEEATVPAHPAPAEPAENLPMMLAGAGGLLAVVSVFLTWTSDAGKISAYGRRADEDLAGQSFNGLEASGGSWFGYVVLATGLFVVLSVLKVRFRPGTGPRWLTTDGAAVASIVMLITTLGHLLASSSPVANDPGTGIGVIVALIAGIVATVGSVMWMRSAPHSPMVPLPTGPSTGRMVAATIGVGLLVIAMFSAWTFDERSETVITDEIQAEIDALRQKAADDPANAAVYASQISSIRAAASSDRIIRDGVTSESARLGIWTLIAGVAALGTCIPAAGLLGSDERTLWLWSSVTAGLGAGVSAISLGWIASLARVSDPNLVSGVGSFIAMLAGLVFVSASLRVLNVFRRTTIYPPISKVAA